MSLSYPEKISDHVTLEILIDDERKSYTSDSEEEKIALKRYQKVYKQCANHFRKRIGHYSQNSAIVDQDDSLNHQEYLGKHTKVQTLESFAQTDSVENTVAIQADIIPKISYDHFQKNQFVQTDEKYHYEGDIFYSDQDWDSNKSEYSDSSNFADSETHPFAKVIGLSSIPITKKRQQDHAGDLEEKTCRDSRWLVETKDSSDSESGPDFAAKTSHANDLTKRVSFCKTISPSVPPMHHFHRNTGAQTEYRVFINYCRGFRTS
ncbi:hypothetical protein AVEN_187524-1 [Araneus ventricosus]|uniref:Uncharacterized protein n=1 Tax=Araneus ventricosus TaxID=182803 RepID=A0A4Y2BSI3_ARAVE|nr:hypothetical protein AVEN_187524-1 [Araneus ventricosus]